MQRIAKIIARAGICSRRAAEELILAGRIKVAGEVVTSLGLKLLEDSEITLDNQPIKINARRLWLYHKPRGLITSHKDENNRPTVFENLPATLPRVISIGRLDYNTEGLLLLTNDGEFSRQMELPSSNIKRCYRVKVYGKLPIKALEQLNDGITIAGVHYKPMSYDIISQNNSNSWLEVSISEGKNREIRKIFQHFGLQVNRLIRISYGAYELGDLAVNQVKEVFIL
jgi:23S rRNA pseudouridine2605 synthase